MKIALISDIHANLPALQACLQQIDLLKPDVVYCLGDLVGYNIWPNEVIHQIRERHIPTIAGNYDQGIGLNSADCGCAYKTESEKAMGAISIAFTNDHIGEEERLYLKTLPKHIRIEIMTTEGLITIMLVHGSPRKINEYLFEDREDESFLRMMEKAGADILCFGHTHKPFHKVLEAGSGDQPKFLHAINIGSVGKPKDGNPDGCFVILSLTEFSSLSDKTSIGVEFIRFPYEVEKAASAIEDSILPDAYAEMLRKGI
jgi:putative phosphoesterase